MPIYEYACQSCGFEKDVLQKMSDAPLSVCPECQQPGFVKRISASSFRLSGSGWYQTDSKAAKKTNKKSEPTDDKNSVSTDSKVATENKTSDLKAKKTDSAA